MTSKTYSSRPTIYDVSSLKKLIPAEIANALKMLYYFRLTAAILNFSITVRFHSVGVGPIKMLYPSIFLDINVTMHEGHGGITSRS